MQIMVTFAPRHVAVTFRREMFGKCRTWRFTRDEVSAYVQYLACMAATGLFFGANMALAAY